MSSTDTNPRFSRSSARPPQSPMGPRLRGPRSPNSPESNPRDSATTPSPINLLVTPLPAVSEKPAQTPPPSPKPLVTTPKATPKRLMLSPPPTLNFDTVPVQWKGLPLEAALWTFNSQELQELVSRAIRLTARESFIRLLSLENLDRALPAEVERLHAMKSSTQSKYRFLVHRRTMLLQALNSSTDSTTNNSSATLNNKDKDGDVVSQLVMQLAQTTAECDRVLEELLRIGDHLSQIERMVDLHWASALAVALRKLNKSYARRTSDLLEARGRIEQLEAELDDAWKEAERIAKEMDDFTMTEFDIEEAVIGKAEKVSLPNSPSPPTPTFGAIMQVDPLPVFSPLSPVPLPSFMRTPSTENGENVPLNFPTPIQHQAQLQPQIQTAFRPQSQPQIPPKDTTDTVSIRSARSTRSTKSLCARTPDGTPTTQLNLVTSARTRSFRASKGSLRLPRFHSRSHSRTGTHQGQDEGDHPPVPNIPLEFSVAPPFPASASPKPSSNIVWPGSSAHSQTSLGRPPHLRTHSRRLSASSGRYRKTSLDDITPPQTSLTRGRERGRERRDSSSSYAPTVAVDDIDVPPPSYHGHDEIQVVPRTPTFILPPVPVLHSPKRKPSNSRSSVDPRKRLSQSVDAALAAVALRLSPSSTPLPPSPLTPSSFDTDMTERGRDMERERDGREEGNRLFSSAGIPSMWLNADSRPNHREQGDHGWERGMTASPPRGRGGEYEGEEEREEHTDGIGNGIGIESGFRNRNGSGNGNDNGNSTGMGNANARQALRPYEKLKTLTKRYSLNFPLSKFVDRTRVGTSSGRGARSGLGSGGWRPTSHVSSPN